MLRPLLLAFSLLAPVPGLSGRAAAQETRAAGEPLLAEGIREADELHALHRPREALDVLHRVLASDSTYHPALWRGAREAAALGMLTGDEEARDTWYREAEAFARRAVDARPEALVGHHWLAVALGRRARHEGRRTQVRLAERVREEALFILERDSLHAGGHHILGEWNAEVMRLRAVTRFVARRLLGADTFDEASWEAAEAHLRRAVELEPDVLIHRLALARVLLDRDQAEEAREHLREVLERPAVEPIDPLLKQQAQELLRDL